MRGTLCTCGHIRESHQAGDLGAQEANGCRKPGCECKAFTRVRVSMKGTMDSQFATSAQRATRFGQRTWL